MAKERYLTKGAALFLVSASITSHQLALMQILSYIQWYHFAYMIVSLALLGFGASGTFFSLYREWLLENCETLLPLLFTACGVSMVIALAPSSLPHLNFDLYLLFVEPGQILRLIIACLIYFLPFFFGGLAIALALTSGIEQVGFFYFANLSGSGAGGLLGLWLANFFLPEQLPPLTGILPVVAALILAGGRHRAKHLIYLAATCSVCLLLLLKPAALLPSQYKDIKRVLNLPDATVLSKTPSPHGLMEIISSSSLRKAAGLSLSFRKEIPTQAIVLVNGDNYGALPLNGGTAKSLLENSTEFSGYLLSRPQEVLLLQPGGGQPLEQALSQKISGLTAVEPHPGLNYILKKGLSSFSGFHNHPGVTLSASDPRAFLAETKESYDLIRFPTAGDTGSNIGMHALSEQYLFSRESFELALKKLDKSGALLASARMDYPARNSLKLLATLIEACGRSGIETPAQHIAAVRSWGTLSIILKKNPITSDESALISSFCKKHGFDPLLLPDINQGERDRFHQLQDRRYFQDVDTLFTNHREQLYREYDFKIIPATDNRPYFSQFLRLDRISHLADLFNLHQIPFFEMGSFILAITLGILTLLAVFLIILPLFKLEWQGAIHTRTLIYFGGLGLGYMVLEIVFIQCLTLFLGHPLTAAATVLCALLLSSGLGSLFSEKLPPRPFTIRVIAGLAILLILVYGGLVIKSGQLVPYIGLQLRVLAVIIAIAPLGFILGMLFPIGLRNLYEMAPGHIPWAWGINGCFSVIGPPLATVVAVQYGFQAVFIMAASAYALAFCSSKE